MFPTGRPIRLIEDGDANGDAATKISAATKEDSPPAFVACFVLPRKQAETLISVSSGNTYPAERASPRPISPHCQIPLPKIPPTVG